MIAPATAPTPAPVAALRSLGVMPAHAASTSAAAETATEETTRMNGLLGWLPFNAGAHGRVPAGAAERCGEFLLNAVTSRFVEAQSTPVLRHRRSSPSSAPSNSLSTASVSCPSIGGAARVTG